MGVSVGLPVELDLEDPGQSPEVSGVVLITDVSQWRVISWICAAMVAGKRCCPIPSRERHGYG